MRFKCGILNMHIEYSYFTRKGHIPTLIPFVRGYLTMMMMMIYCDLLLSACQFFLAVVLRERERDVYIYIYIFFFFFFSCQFV